MPTTRPRYTVTDTGALRMMLDAAQRRWPEVQDRRRLLLRLAELGAGSIESEESVLAATHRRERQQQALQRAGELVDAEALLSDAAWR